MSGIRGKNTKPEMIVRTGLHRRGFRYRLHDRRLPGKPDLVFPKYQAVIFVHGCFWHGHDCALFRLPKTRTEFWAAKINRNRDTDTQVSDKITLLGWRQGVIWECALKRAACNEVDDVIDASANWLKSPVETFEAQGALV